MNRRSLRWLAVAALAVLLTTTGCARGDAGVADDAGPPAEKQQIPGTDVQRVILTDATAQRIGVQTAPVRAAAASGTSKAMLVIPASAVIYDPKGASWTYSEEATRTYVRKPIAVDRVDGDEAFLTSGPSVGTTVVTVGASELLGIEYGVGEE